MPGRGWIAAIELKAGTRVQLVNGEYAIVNRVYKEELSKPVTVYNFEVEGFHTYFVSELGVLVHNRCEGQDSSYKKMNDRYIKNQGIDPHQVKKEFLTNNSKISQYDLYGDINTGNIVIFDKKGNFVVETYYKYKNK